MISAKIYFPKIRIDLTNQLLGFNIDKKIYGYNWSIECNANHEFISKLENFLKEKFFDIDMFDDKIFISISNTAVENLNYSQFNYCEDTLNLLISGNCFFDNIHFWK